MPTHPLFPLGVFASVVLATLAFPARAQSLHDMVEAASGRHPELVALQGRREVTSAKQQAASAWTPGPPSLSGSYLTDQAFRDRRQREAQIGISTPLWLPGEGTASRRVADAEATRFTAQADALKLKLAGQVREALAEFALAQADLTAAERKLREARTLESDVGRRVSAREASEADQLLARAERLSTESELREKRTALEQSRLEFLALTGLPPAVAALNERPAVRPAPAHPRLDDANGAVNVARANQALAGIQVRESPEVGVIARRTRDVGSTIYNNSIGVELRIPFATEARNGTRRATAQADVTEAAANFAAAQREIATEQQKAKLGYDSAIAQRDLAIERRKALAQQSGLMARGYQAGQLSLLDFIRARSLAFDAEATAARAEVTVARASGRLNQSFGILP